MDDSLITNTEILVTAFPQRWDTNDPVSKTFDSGAGDIIDTENIVESILGHLKQKNRSPITSVFDLSEMIMARCLGLNFNKAEWEHERYPYLEIFDSAVSNVVNEEIRCFNDFAESVKIGSGRSNVTVQTEREAEKARKKVERKADKERDKRERDKDKRMKVRKRLEKKDNQKVTKKGKEVEKASSERDKGPQEQLVLYTPRRTEHSRGTKKREEEDENKKRRKKQVEESTKRFFDDFAKIARRIRKANTSTNRPKKKPEELFDISREVELIQEVKDIQEELNILGNLYNQQKLVLGTFERLIGEARAAAEGTGAKPTANEPTMWHAIQRHIDFVKEIEGRTALPYRHLEDLLDLKQKQANVFEARTVRVSGNTITVFTIVTIIFLPASFMATFLALPIKEYPTSIIEGEGDEEKMELNFAAKYTVIVTFALATPFIIFAIYVNPILRVANRVKELLSKAWWFMVRIWNFLAAFGLILMRVGHMLKRSGLYLFSKRRVVGRFIANIAKLLYRFVGGVHLKGMYRWFKGMRQTRKDTLGAGLEWRKRQYVVHWLLGLWRRAINRKEKASDVEEQMSTRSVVTLDETADGEVGREGGAGVESNEHGVKDTNDRRGAVGEKSREDEG